MGDTIRDQSQHFLAALLCFRPDCLEKAIFLVFLETVWCRVHAEAGLSLPVLGALNLSWVFQRLMGLEIKAVSGSCWLNKASTHLHIDAKPWVGRGAASVICLLCLDPFRRAEHYLALLFSNPEF